MATPSIPIPRAISVADWATLTQELQDATHVGNPGARQAWDGRKQTLLTDAAAANGNPSATLVQQIRTFLGE